MDVKDSEINKRSCRCMKQIAHTVKKYVHGRRPSTMTLIFIYLTCLVGTSADETKYNQKMSLYSDTINERTFDNLLGSDYKKRRRRSIGENDQDLDYEDGTIPPNEDGDVLADNKYFDDLGGLFRELYKGPVCSLIDVRNNPDDLKDLENCTIVNGFVQILFMHNTTEKDFQKYTFPKLRVITQYLLVFRVHGLRSLRHMFPNLAVIEGRRVFYDYAMVIYENPHLTELGLGNLHYIRRGGVRVQKNNQLCYLGSVDWPRLGQVGKLRNKDIDKRRIMNNGDRDVCLNQCSSDCNSLDSETGQMTPHCWGVNLCQTKQCPSNCPDACMNGKCVCHSECLVGCSKPRDASACISCKNTYNNGTCVNECPRGTLLMEGWKCVTPTWCSHVGWVIHERECMNRCPYGYTDWQDNDVYVCVQCKENNCRKVCGQPSDVFQVTDNLNDLRHVEGCTSILGRLVISVKGGVDIVNALGEGLTDLQSVGALVVQRSSALASLEILKNLRRITGHPDALKNGIYSVYVLENENLKYLWNFGNITLPMNSENDDISDTNNSRRKDKKRRRKNKDGSRSRSKRATTQTTTLQIGGGKAFFHFNSRLCLKEIKKLSDLTAEVEDNTDISETTNGDRASCDMMNLEIVSMVGLPNKGMGVRQNITWNQVKVDDKRTLLGYQIYYKESWEIRDMLMIGDTEKAQAETQNMILDNLKPYTQYALYLRTYTTLSANRGAQSEIVYFITNPTAPSEPRDVIARAVNTSSINVEWIPPRYANGRIVHYEVRWKRQTEYTDPVYKINTCLTGYNRNFHVVETPNVTPDTTHVEDNENKVQLIPEGCCSCDGSNIHVLQANSEDSQRFEDLLHARMFGSRIEGFDSGDILSRKRRSENSNIAVGGSTSQPYTNETGIPVNATEIEDIVIPNHITPNEYVWESTIVKGNNITITGLHHFSEYDIQVLACNHAANDTVYGKNNETYFIGCSYEAITSKRTLPILKADSIPPLSFHSSTVSKNIEVNEKTIEKSYNILRWTKPIDPNGYIKYYLIEITDESGDEIDTQCYSVFEFTNMKNKYELSNSYAPGLYQARVKPVSISGEGMWTEYVKFEVQSPPSKRTWIHYMWIIVAVIALVMIIIALISVQCLMKKRRETNARNAITVASVNPEYARLFLLDEYEVDNENVELLRQIGHGNFGKVFEGLAKSIIRGQETTRVAVKKLHGDASVSRRVEFLKEADVMKAFNSYHVVRLLGVVSQVPEPMVIMELMEKGDLKSYLRSRREGAEENTQNLPPPNLQEKLQMAAEIADGMAYLAENKFVHRDLAARNCLVHENGTVKIGDFGLTRDIYATDYYRKDSRGFLPIRWMAPESLKDGVFDSSSDVWSFGIVLWEISTLSEQPYQGRAHDEVTRFVMDGGYMERPIGCPKKLYDMMLMCWEFRPGMRPTFLEVIETMLNDVSENFKNNSFYYEHKAKNEKVEEIAHLLLQRGGGSVHGSLHAVSSRQHTPTCRTPRSRGSNCSSKLTPFVGHNQNQNGGSSRSSNSNIDTKHSPSGTSSVENNNHMCTPHMSRGNSNGSIKYKRKTDGNYYTVKSSDSDNSLSEASSSKHSGCGEIVDDFMKSTDIVDDDCYASLSMQENGESSSTQPLIQQSQQNKNQPSVNKPNETNGYHPNNYPMLKDSKYFESNTKAPSPPLFSPPPLPRNIS